MKAVTLSQIQAMEAYAINDLGIPRLSLMEAAGAHVARTVIKMVGARGPVLIIAGKGFNGGDALVAAKYLRNQGIPLHVVLTADPKTFKGETKLIYSVLKGLGVSFRIIATEKDVAGLRPLLNESVVVVDGILGTGISQRVSGHLGKIIQAVNDARRKRRSSKRRGASKSTFAPFPLFVISVDIPSGLNAGTGRVMGCSVEADTTVTFHFPKKGLMTGSGPRVTGKLIVADIGIPYEFPAQSSAPKPPQWAPGSTEILTAQEISALIPPRFPDSHKGDFGHVLMIAGSRKMPGAALLACRAALRSGAGRVTLAAPESICLQITASTPEIITLPLPEGSDGTLSPKGVAVIARSMAPANHATHVIACGPGMTTSSSASRFLTALINKKWNIPLILDADALNILSQKKSGPIQWGSDVILTPHPGELSRLIGKSIEEIQKKRVEYAKITARSFRSVVVLKGAGTLITSPSGICLMNTNGNAGMATAGMGDVLTGLIAGLTAQGIPALEAAASGVFLHGHAGDLTADIKGECGLVASDVIEMIPTAIGSIRQGGGVSHV